MQNLLIAESAPEMTMAPPLVEIDLTSTAHLGPEVWYVKGTSVFHHDQVSLQDYAPVLSSLKVSLFCDFPLF